MVGVVDFGRLLMAAAEAIVDFLLFPVQPLYHLARDGAA
jgi:hypothetical protein